MTKKISKFLLALLLIISLLSSLTVCFAEVDGDKTKAVTTSETETTTNAETTGESNTEKEIHNGDLYLFDNNIVMDQLVDGNVFIFGNNVEITGQVNGNLFVFANTVKFEESYVVHAIYVFANSVYYNGYCNDLYVATNNLETTYNSIVYRDIKSLSSYAILKSAIGRDADLIGDTIDFGSDNDTAAIYGNLRYSSNKEINIPEGVMASDKSTTTYTKPSNLDSNNSSILDILIGFGTCIVTVLGLYFILQKSAPNFVAKLSDKKLSVAVILKSFGIGLATLALVTLFFILLAGTMVGVNLAFILILLFATLCLIAVPALTIIIANILKPALKIEKNSMFCLIIVLVNVILYGVGLIPFIGWVLGFVIKMTAIGLLVDMYLPHKELTDDEKTAIEEAKKQAKEQKANRKQKKAEIKAAKKQEKLEAKELNKKEKNN